MSSGLPENHKEPTRDAKVRTVRNRRAEIDLARARELKNDNANRRESAEGYRESERVERYWETGHESHKRRKF